MTIIFLGGYVLAQKFEFQNYILPYVILLFLPSSLLAGILAFRPPGFGSFLMRATGLAWQPCFKAAVFVYAPEIFPFPPKAK